MREVMLGFLAIGVVAPLTAFTPWLFTHGFDVALFIEQMVENRISTFFALDVIVSALVLITAAVHAHHHGGRGLWMVVGSTLLVGVSAGLPLYFYFRICERISYGGQKPDSPDHRTAL